jgi:hypothetical protein
MRGERFQNDICPEDEFEAWRERWDAVLIYKKNSGYCPKLAEPANTSPTRCATGRDI